MAWLSVEIQERLAIVLAHFLWQGALIAGLLAAAVALLRVRRPNARYALSLVAFGMMATCPVVTWFVAPELGVSAGLVPTEPTTGQLPKTLRQTTALRPACPDGSNDWYAHQPNSRGFRPGKPDGERLKTEVSSVADQLLIPPGQARRKSTAISAATWVERLRPWEPWMIGGWLTGVVLLSLRLLLGAFGLWRWRRATVPLPESLAPVVARLCEAMRMAQPTVTLCRRVSEAVALGLFKPMILLPVSWATELPPDMLEAVLAHELAHVRRFDLWVNLLQRLVETLLFYHPAVWWLSRRLRIERELCCDDLAATVTNNRLRYAETLEHVARLSQSRPASSLALAMASRDGALLHRVRQLLQSPHLNRTASDSSKRSSSGWIAGLIVIAMLIVLIGSWQWTVGQVSNLPANESAEDVAVASSDNQTQNNGDGQVENLTHETFVGTVEKPDGSRAAGATVIAVRYMPFASRESRQVVTADDQGVFSLRRDGFAGAKALWFVSAVLGDDGGRLGESISVPEDEPIHFPIRPWQLNRVIRLKPGRTVSGTVLDAATRKPIADANVYAEDGRVVATDACGRFTLRGLPADVVGFIVTSPGLVRTQLDVDVSERAAADVEIALARGGTIRGRVLDPEGRPVVNAGVSGENNNSILSAAVTEITDAEGRFTFDGFPVNKLIYPLDVSAVGLGSDDGNALTLHGPGDTQEITIRLPKSDVGSILRWVNSLTLTEDRQPPVGTIRGRVVLRGQPVRNFTVRLVSPAQDEPEDGRIYSLSLRHFTVDDGRFVIGRLDADKRYRVAVTAEDESFAIVEPIYARAASALTDKEEVEFPLRPAHQLRVRILDADTQQPISNVRVGFKAEYPRREGFDWNSPPSGSRIEWTAADGVAAFGNLAAESGPIFVEHPGFARQQIYWTRPQNADGSSKQPDAEQLVLSLRKEARLRIRVSGLDGREFKYIFANVKPATNEFVQSFGSDAQEPRTLEMRMLPPGLHSLTIHDNAMNKPWTPLLTHEIELKPGDNELEVELPPAPKGTEKVDE